MNPAMYRIQVALNSLGHHAGPNDGYWGPKTRLAALNLSAQGPVNATVWALQTLARGLSGMGYYDGPATPHWGFDLKSALFYLLQANGLAKVEAADPKEILTPTKPRQTIKTHDRQILQGKKGYIVDTFMLHVLAVPGDWHEGKTNHEMLEAVRTMHMEGNGWRDIGYTSLGTPDGSILMGRPETEIGAGAIGHNRGVWHHVMVEVATIDRMGRPEDWLTPATIVATRQLIEKVADRTPINRLLGHNEVARKLCPGFKVVDEYWTKREVA